MNILAFETSCDETSVAVVRDGRKLLSNEVLSQTDLHALYGGVVPEIASRSHLEAIAPLTAKALSKVSDGIDAVAATAAPGLIGALLVGLNFAKGYAMARNLPLVPVHHIRGHVAAAYLAEPDLEPPFLAAVVSGGNTQFFEVLDYTTFRVAGGTRDDAAGEAFDKGARLLGLGYPGGAALDKLAARGRPDAYRLPRPQVEGHPYDMSFSGLKTAALNVINGAGMKGGTVDKAGLAASFTAAVCEALVSRTALAIERLGHSTCVLAGGVAANTILRRELTVALPGRTLYMPPMSLCGDNAAMIGAQAYYEWLSGVSTGMSLNGYADFPVDKQGVL